MLYYASQSHYFDHLYPIWQATPHIPFYVDRNILPYVQSLLPPESTYLWPLPKDRQVCIVSSYQDYLSTRNRPCIFVEHGAGQRYEKVESGSYSGGPGRDRCIAFLAPSESVAHANQQRYPATPNHIIGSPAVSYLSGRRNHPVWGRGQYKSLESQSTVAITFHWECDICPETRSAYEHYKSILTTLQSSQEFTLIGHHHPKYTTLPTEYHRRGIQVESHWSRLAPYIDLLIADNSSVIYEAAALDIPVIILNAPWYRRHVHHGLRFWDTLPGPLVDHPDELLAYISKTLANPSQDAALRQSVTQKVYGKQHATRDQLAEIINSYES